MQPIVPCLLLLCITVRIIYGQSTFDIDELDWSIRPVDDFFSFVNQRWLNRTEVPPSQTIWGGIYTMQQENWLKLKTIVDELTDNGTTSSPHPVDSIERKIGDLYLAGLDEKKINRLGLQPLELLLQNLQAVTTYQELIMFTLDLYKRMNRGVIFEFDVVADDRNSSVYMVNFRQTGLNLPERDYYFRNDPVSKRIRTHYIDYIHRILTLSNDAVNMNTTLIDAEDILSIETQIAASHWAPNELRDPVKNYNKFTVVELDGMMPSLGWHRILSVLTIPNTTVLVSQPDYYRSLDKLIVSQSLSIWKNKIRFSIIHDLAGYLSEPFSIARFEMFNRLIYGQREQKPRWTRVLMEIDKGLGDLLGQLYVIRYFPIEAKARMLDLVDNIIDTYRARIYRLKWMSDETKVKAIEKLNFITKKIGYPSKWKSYDDVHIQRTTFFGSIMSIFRHDFRKKLKDLRKPVDRSEWQMTPQTTNAYYYGSYNEIVFPAAILQEPYFSLVAEDALNYGAIGCIIGHEITHGFDDEGHHYDAHGNLGSWWTPADINAFNARTQKIIEQFNAFKVLNTPLNGLLTLGENIADLGGIVISFEAFRRTKQAQEGVLVSGFTPEQRFFLAYARASRAKLTNGTLLSFIKKDPHAPPIARVDCPLSNIDAFYQAFNVTEGDGMYRASAERVVIW